MTIETNYGLEQAKAQAESIVLMVGALECDYERLEELREAKKECAFIAGHVNMASSEPGEQTENFTTFERAQKSLSFDLHELFEELSEAGQSWASGEVWKAKKFVQEQTEPFTAVVCGRAYWIEAGALCAEEQEELAELEELSNGCEDREEAEQTIQDDPLSVEIRSDWQSVGDLLTATEFCVLLCTGGPAVRILGELDEHLQPCRAWIEYQDWGTTWTHLSDCPASQDTLLTYCQQFYFGEG